MAPKVGGGGSGGSGGGVVAKAKAAVGFISDRGDFRRNLLVNVALFAAGVWVARNVADLDLMAPAPLQ